MLDTITWNNQHPSPELLQCLDQEVCAAWLTEVAKSHGRRIGEINYVFCSDSQLLEVNRQFLGHDYFTDIITFDYSHGRVVSGDVYISLDTVASNAGDLGLEENEEFHRVLAHGLLHLCGINDKGPGEREIMEAHENEALKMKIQELNLKMKN